MFIGNIDKQLHRLKLLISRNINRKRVSSRLENKSVTLRSSIIGTRARPKSASNEADEL